MGLSKVAMRRELRGKINEIERDLHRCTNERERWRLEAFRRDFLGTIKLLDKGGAING